ncbi:hypothetical protein Poli38472_014541 [Pythium oligandrum]|uniref:Sec20 C-terminal domain-containing protein n=1 Tax=Pythium oligandrum TaxID=41045 RepID=A0A8K1FEZ5_PYTOL|nr:hypothetical protein Poli38472_014541 [Pythium oligandrum]|eukprot:TMW61080.1 hypothetical protein Poli38472_014541 [Pythium oligandrum]
MQRVEDADRALTSHLAFVARALDTQTQTQVLKYTVEEEQALEDRLNGAVETYHKAVTEAEDWLVEVTDPQVAATERERLTRLKDTLKTHVVGVRKVLVAYRQKAKIERLNHARSSVMQKSTSANKTDASRSGSAVDVTAALKRTRRVMTEEVQRIGSVTKVLDDGRASLKSSHVEFDTVNAEIAEVRKRLKILQWQAQQDRMWIAAGIAILASTVLYIVHQRTGLLII